MNILIKGSVHITTRPIVLGHINFLIHNSTVAILRKEQPNTPGDAKITTNSLRHVNSTNNNSPLYSINYHILTLPLDNYAVW